MNASQLKKLLTAYLKNRLNKTDKNLVQNWYDAFGESEAGVPGLGNQREEQLLKDDLLNRIQVQLNQPERPVYRLMSFRNMAASIVLVAGAGLATWFFLAKSAQEPNAGINQFQVITTISGQMKKVILPDSSVVHLNANSRIRVPHRFSLKDRQFYLEEGEAFFEVTKDKTRPFIIHSGQLNVKVLGTSFNVRSYRQLSDIKVTVTTGKVRVSGNGMVYGTLVQGQQITYNKANRAVQRSEVRPSDNQAWINGKVYLEKADFDELALTMRNMYGVSLKNETANKLKYQYNLTIRSDRSLQETLKLICAINGHHYKKKGKEILIY
ncbi:transmembrane sensor [Pedobacter africanus]|uniref:Ferric-dicitrate binding protein FerR (Iron transport regulator) n=1 Tax=Pedobacter africanus TaxID=151894 RepID=A0ACC6KRS6_9SPHI|nr:FecR domain-containing protein [Pedobacter africanus]MDR6782034.1 ferric-dicitrate binding protein FerR (iron transport regulator) [Pedobacter africanus]